MSGPSHDIFYVWAPGYETYKTKCEQILNTLYADPALSSRVVFPYTQVLNSSTIYEAMELVQFAPAPGR